MYGREKYIASSAVKYRIKVRLADCAINLRRISVLPRYATGMIVISGVVGFFSGLTRGLISALPLLVLLRGLFRRLIEHLANCILEMQIGGLRAFSLGAFTLVLGIQITVLRGVVKALHS